MAEVVRHIGLSLGADICWPLCFEAIMRELDLRIPVGGDTVRFEVERVTIEPFDLRQPCKYDLVVDRLTHWYHTSREWIKKAILMDDLYVFNNPWSVQANEKHTTYCAMMQLGMPIPETWMVPPKSYEPNPDLKPTLTRYAKLFDVSKLGDRLGWPMFMKPYDGGGWRGVTKVDDTNALWKAYEESGKSVMHIQAGVNGFDRFVRCIGFGPQTHCVLYDPDAPLHDRYTTKTEFMTKAEEEHLRKVTLTINSFFGWEFNSCESLRRDGIWHPIDFANPCPDSQVTSLHGHFPWLVKAYVRWVVFCAATKRKMRKNQDWSPFYEVAALDLPYEEKLSRYAAIADERFETARFEEFCAKHLGHLDEVAWSFFGTNGAKDAVRQKVTALFPPHEVERFTELFWSRIQDWRGAPTR
ncbi:hypothetical protein AKJ09_10735 [Labilithrix luteola]|uniref:ATP-grasp domain-containing protein n=1 Tax=Labilithrix luteola TaxID=1391654 RepID=A0A0K1QEH6_9BACT|nr:hypothetical protein [Labilithrix luteola]AKV04072.1 hypothetical protein AKJ09_10735 [Labilithrix luteola]